MKKIFFLMAFSLVLLLIGCNENSASNPVSPDTINKSASGLGTEHRGDIYLDQKLQSPDVLGDYFQLNGDINYTEETLGQIPQSSIAGLDEKLDISIEATLTDISVNTTKPVIWKISSESGDLVTLPQNGSNELVKTYLVPGRTDKLELVCTFTVTLDGLKLKNAVLQSAMV